MESNKFIIPWGKHQGEYLSDLPTSYLEHIENTIEDEKIKSLVMEELDYREKSQNFDGGK